MEILEAIRAYITALCVALLALSFAVLFLCSLRDKLSRLFRAVKSHPIMALFISAPLFVFVLHGSTKPSPVTPTVKGITLGSPMETPTSVELEWAPDDGTEIKSNQLVRVYYRDASNPKWQLAAEGYGITNAVVKGFFIWTDTDWLVEIEGETNKVEEVIK
jgi:hypothetical protein